MAGPIVITGGGTGGHIFPMRAIADELLAQGVTNSELRFVGSRRGQDERLLRGSVPMTLLRGRGIRRSWRFGDVVVNVGAALGLASALVTSLVLIRRWRPAVVVSVGGYASFATVLSAVVWRRALVLVDVDSTPGAVHRRFARYATVRCSAVPSDGANVVVTGTPVRAAVERISRSRPERANAKAAMSPPIDVQRTVVVVMTGSLGSARVNDAVVELANQWAHRNDRAIIHVTGERDFERISRRIPERANLDYRVIAFADMVELWAICDVAVCRAGATTLGELSVLAIPSILVPLPGAPGDHQTKNALVAVRAGAARLLEDRDCNASTLGELLDEVVRRDELERMERGANSIARPHAAKEIARVVLNVRG